MFIANNITLEREILSKENKHRVIHLWEYRVSQTKDNSTKSHPGLPVYYVASKVRSSTPGPSHGISSRDGCYLVMRYLPLLYYSFFIDILFWGRDPLQRPGRGWAAYIACTRKSVVGTPAGAGQGSNVVDMVCLESTNWVRVSRWLWFYLIHVGGCTLDRVIWLAALFHRGLWREILPILPAVVGANWACDVLPAAIGMANTVVPKCSWSRTVILVRLRGNIPTHTWIPFSSSVNVYWINKTITFERKNDIDIKMSSFASCIILPRIHRPTCFYSDSQTRTSLIGNN
jgi:hypothetical protein